MSDLAPPVTSTGPGPTARPERPVFTVVVAVVLTALVAGVLTGRVSQSPDGTTTAAWTPTSSKVIFGDTWDGNFATDGSRVYLLTREGIDGFWGVLRIRWSDDAGATWSQPVRVSTSDEPNAARHALALDADGTLWAAWAEQGARPMTQRLMLRRSTDGGATWGHPNVLSSPTDQTIGIPALVVTPSLRFVAYTEAHGAMITQPFDVEGRRADVPPSRLGLPLGITTRQLYTDSPLPDGGISVASDGDTAIAVINDAVTGVYAMRSTDGLDWLSSDKRRGPVQAAGRMTIDEGRFVALLPFDGPDGQTMDIQESIDSGDSWRPLGTWVGPTLGAVSLPVGNDRAIVVWQACDSPCRTSQIHIADVASVAGGGVTVKGAMNASVAGAVIVRSTLVVAWFRDGPPGIPSADRLTVASGPLPTAAP